MLKNNATQKHVDEQIIRAAQVSSSNSAACSTENRPTPYFERKNGENVALVIEEMDEFGEFQKTRQLLSERSAKRLLSELADFL